MTNLNILKENIKKFMLERDWDKSHNPKDLVIALVSEVGELAECYRWLSDEQVEQINSDKDKKIKIEEEIADILIYLIILAYKSNIDITSIIEEKMEKNKLKFPVEKFKGISTNPIIGTKGKI